MNRWSKTSPRPRRRRTPVGAMVALAALVLVSTLSTSASAQTSTKPEFTQTACPEITDSIYRLYQAYFLREPDEGGFNFWVSEYASGSRNLDLASRFFKESPEFIRTYGQLDNAAFVTLIYANVMERQPDPGGYDYWVGQLDAGLDRGTVMLFFSESEEFVTKTDTWEPLAGYLRWYPIGTQVNCGWGSGNIGLLGAGTYFDFLVANVGTAPTTFRVSFTESDGSTTQSSDIALDSRHYLYDWNLRWTDEKSFNIVANSDVFWTYVEYPTPMAADRPGWPLLVAGDASVDAGSPSFLSVDRDLRAGSTPRAPHAVGS